MKKRMIIFVAGRDRPGILASLTRVLYQNRARIEDFSNALVRGQAAIILIASTADPDGQLQTELAGLAEDLGLHIHIEAVSPQDLIPESDEKEGFILTIRGKHHPGLIYGITEVLAERGINIMDVQALRNFPEAGEEYLQVFEVGIPRGVNLDLIREKLEKRGAEMGVRMDLYSREDFRTVP